MKKIIPCLVHVPIIKIKKEIKIKNRIFEPKIFDTINNNENILYIIFPSYNATNSPYL